MSRETDKLGEWEQRLAVERVVPHEGYNDNTFQNDIAVVKVLGKFNCTAGRLFPACLPRPVRYTTPAFKTLLI